MGGTGKLSAATWVPVLLFALFLTHGSLLGLTDDEAYYWVLAQKPALGYAFHPPAVAWLIAASQKLLSPLFQGNSALVVRFPSALLTAGFLALALRWMKRAGVPESGLLKGALGFLGFAGVFGTSWMMVPDLPLLFAWMLAFVTVWDLCFGTAQGSSARSWLLGLASGVALLSKFSGVLVAFSSAAALLVFARPVTRWRGWAWIAAGLLLAAVPIVVWNARNGWGALLYQFHDRHSGSSLSGLRYLRFWVIQALIAGPPLLLFALRLPVRLRPSQGTDTPVLSRYVALWALPPAAVFLVQPLFSEFKAHWALIVWLPVALELAVLWARTGVSRMARAQTVYGLVLSSVVLLSCHVALLPWVAGAFRGGATADPRLDVTNDMYGWSALPRMLQGSSLPVVASRYQTASQAAFALGGLGRATLLPRDRKQLGEWEDLRITDHQGPGWPRLMQPVWFVGDNRYDAAPEFKDARCERQEPFEQKRGPFLAKRILLWKCTPQGPS